MKRKIVFFKDHFLNFYFNQSPEVQKKIDWTFELIRDLEMIPEKYFKHLSGTSGLYEIRVHLGTNQIRIFSFFDSGKLVILINGFLKKTKKTPKQELELAISLMEEYFNEKGKH